MFNARELVEQSEANTGVPVQEAMGDAAYIGPPGPKNDWGLCLPRVGYTTCRHQGNV